MTSLAMVSEDSTTPREHATRVAAVGALAATTMLFASLVSAYLVRRSFADWRPSPALWPFVLLALALGASAGIEVASRSVGAARGRGFMALALSSALYIAGALAVIVSVALSPGGLSGPHNAFVALLLSVHVVHALLGASFSVWALRDGAEGSGENGLLLTRLVTHFLTALLFAIVFVLFVLQ
jgi:heme/copper-type cytochrome/quinol oxidase subunit 3